MRVVLLTHYFPPEVGAAQTRIAELARGLAARGCSVTVHTGFPHYPDGVVPPPYRTRRVQVERDGPVRVVRTWVYATPNRGIARRLAGHASFGASAVAHARLTGPADVVVAESPPLFTAGAAVLYARALRAPLVLNCSDLWPESAVAVGALDNARAIALAERLERWCYRHAATVTVPVPGMATAAAARGARAEVMGPAVDVQRFAAVPDVAREASAPLRVLYAGTVGLAQRLETVVEAARLAGPAVVRLTVAGGGPDLAAVRTAAQRTPNVTVVDAVPADAVPALYAAHDAAVVPLRDRPLFAHALPTKLYEALAAGRPVLVAAPEGAATELVTRTQTGVVVAPEDPAALAAAFRELAGAPFVAAAFARAGRRVAAAEFDRAAAVDRWADLLRRVTASRR